MLTELSVADFSKLVRGGFEPLGIVAWSSVFFASYNYGPGMAGGGMMSVRGDAELRAAGVHAGLLQRARERDGRAERAGIHDRRLGDRRCADRPPRGPHTLSGGMGGRERSGLMVTFNAIGTAIRQTDEVTLHPPETTIDLTAAALRQPALPPPPCPSTTPT